MITPRRRMNEEPKLTRTGSGSGDQALEVSKDQSITVFLSTKTKLLK